MPNRRVGGVNFSTSDEATKSKGAVTANSSESQTLAAANDARVALVVTNASSSTDAWLALGNAAAAEEGIYLKAGGGGIVIDFYTGRVSVRTKSGEALVTFVEV